MLQSDRDYRDRRIPNRGVTGTNFGNHNVHTLSRTTKIELVKYYYSMYMGNDKLSCKLQTSLFVIQDYWSFRINKKKTNT